MVSGHKGHAVIALRRFHLGELVLIGRAVSVLPERTTHSFQKDWDAHVELDAPTRFMNHSCQPNTGVVDNSQDGYDFVALQETQPGDELTWDYETTEYVSIAVPRCLCATENCRTRIHGYWFRRHDESWRPTHIARYLSDQRAAPPATPARHPGRPRQERQGAT
ncbi:MAG: SET domain-containing protein-lysine N-methyltransferase [Pseudonocardiaceae bacterium]